MAYNTDFITQILTPRDAYTPIPFWFFNDTPDENRISQQLEEYVRKGVNGIVLHPRIGIPEEIGYLSDEFFTVITVIVKKAHELDMKIVLYDEGMYPSGSAHGQVVKLNPAFASKGIRLHEDGKTIVYEYTQGTIRGIHFGEDDGEAGAPPSADILNPDAVDAFIHLTHDRYYEVLREYFGKTIIGFFTDEPSAVGRNASSYKEWLPRMEEEILQAGGSMEDLVGIFKGYENKTTKIYHQLVKKHLRENYYKKLFKWCEEHHIALMGHSEASDDVEETMYFHIPGQDLILRRVAMESGGLLEFDSVQAKLTADIARHLGRERNANECFGVCHQGDIPWHFTGKDMLWYINWLGFRGVNLFIPHAFYYSVEGERQNERPPDVGPNNIWWPHYRRISDYMKRLSYLMTGTKSYAKIAVLCDNNQVPYKEIACLYENQIDFHYLPIQLINEPLLAEYEILLDFIGWHEKEAYDRQGSKVLSSTDWIIESKSKYQVVSTIQPCNNLRATRFQKDGQDVILLSNEGKVPILSRIKLNDSERFIAVDLWSGRCDDFNWHHVEEGCSFDIELGICEMRVFVIDDQRRDNKLTFINLGNITEHLILIEKSVNTAWYNFDYETDYSLINQHQKGDGLSFIVEGEEMAECYCDGQLVDFSLFSPHRFTISQELKPIHSIQIKYTGSAANIYENANISFGIESILERTSG